MHLLSLFTKDERAKAHSASPQEPPRVNGLSSRQCRAWSEGTTVEQIRKVFVAASPRAPANPVFGSRRWRRRCAADSLEIPLVSSDNVVANRKRVKTMRGVNVSNKSTKILALTVSSARKYMARTLGKHLNGHNVPPPPFH